MKWLKNLFKSRVQRDRERGYYSDLPPVAGTLDQLNKAFAKKYRSFAEVRETTTLHPTRWARLKFFYGRFGIPNPKQLLMLLWPSQWLSETLWRRWDPEDANARMAPAAGHYDADTGTTYCADGRVVQKKIHIPGA